MMVAGTRLVIVSRLFSIAAIMVGLVIGAMEVVQGGRRNVFMHHLRAVLDAIHQAGGR